MTSLQTSHGRCPIPILKSKQYAYLHVTTCTCVCVYLSIRVCVLSTPITAPPEKMQRLSDLSSSPSNGLEESPSLNPRSSPSHLPYHTPSRHSSSRGHLVTDSNRATRGRKRDLQEGNGTISLSDTRELMDEALSPSAAYFASPSPPSPPHSPTSPSLDTALGSVPQKSPSRLSRDRVNDSSMGYQSPQKYKCDRTTQKTPKKQEEDREYPTTPSSATRYQRALDVSTVTPEQRSPKHSKAFILDRFDAVYHGLTSRSKDEVNYWETGQQEGEQSPVLDRHGRLGSDSTPAPASSGVLTRAPAGPYITVTGSNGKRVYMRLHKERVSLECTHVTVLYRITVFLCVYTCTCTYYVSHAHAV